MKVDIWECDWEGIYSDESAENSLGETYLRGYQLTNSSGYTAFETVYPGWYAGRTPHIHFRLRVYDGVNGALSYDETTQLFFNDTMTDYIYANIAPYTSHPGRDTTNATDRVYAIQNQLNLTGDYTNGFSSFLHLTIPLGGTSSNYILGNATNAGGGGGGSTTTTSGGGGAASNSGGSPSGGGNAPTGGNQGGPGGAGSSGAGGAGSAPAGGSSAAGGMGGSAAGAGSSAAAGGGGASGGSAPGGGGNPASGASSSSAAVTASMGASSAATSAATGSLCFLLYSLPGNVDYPWSSATSLTFTYTAAGVTTGQAVSLLSGSGTRTYTNRFGASFSTSLTLASFPSSNLLYLGSAVPVDTTGLTFSLASSIQLPGEGPSQLLSAVTVYNASGGGGGGRVVHGGRNGAGVPGDGAGFHQRLHRRRQRQRAGRQLRRVPGAHLVHQRPALAHAALGD